MAVLKKVQERLREKVLDVYEHSSRRVYIMIEESALKEASLFLFKELGLRFATASGQQIPEGFEILYHFSDDSNGQVVSLKVLLQDKEKPRVDSIASIIKGAEWIEREMWELLGIEFSGHENMRRLLLAEEWPQGNYPLRHEEK